MVEILGTEPPKHLPVALSGSRLIPGKLPGDGSCVDVIASVGGEMLAARKDRNTEVIQQKMMMWLMGVCGYEKKMQ